LDVEGSKEGVADLVIRKMLGSVRRSISITGVRMVGKGKLEGQIFMLREEVITKVRDLMVWVIGGGSRERERESWGK
jgi:hypothetical protein